MTLNSLRILLLWFFLALLLQIRPIDDFDIFTCISLGQIVLDTHELVKNEQFSYLLAGQEIANPGWLAQCIFALLYRLGGWPAIKFVYGLIFSGAFIIAGKTALLLSNKQARAISMISIMVAAVIGFIVAGTNNSVRPQGFAVLAFSLFIWVMNSEWSIKKQLFFCLPIFVLWQNIHISLTIVLVQCLVLLLSGLFSSRRNSLNATLIQAAVLGSCSFFCQFLTPDLLNILTVSNYNLDISRNLLGVTEWQPPWFSSVYPAMIAFWIVFFITLLGIIIKRKVISPYEFISFIIYSALSLFASRFSLFWAIVNIPLWSTLIEIIKPKSLFNWVYTQNVSQKLITITCIAGLTCVLGFSIYGPQTAPDIPLKAIALLKDKIPTGNIYNYPQLGGPLILLGSPQWKIHIDGRLYLYNKEQWRQYYREALGQVSLREIIMRYQPAVFFLYSQFQSKLIKLIQDSSQWQLIFQDEKYSVFISNVQPGNVTPQ